MSVRRWIAGVIGLAGLVMMMLLLITIPVAAQDAANGEELYIATCAACHQVDGTGIEGTFPPLADNPNALDAEYVADAIRNGRSGPIEVNGVSYDSEMPALGSLSDDVIADIVAFLATNEFPEEEPAAPPPPAGPGAADFGEALFLGSDRFENGGAACVACHTAGGRGNLGGQSMGPDLTNVLDTFGGEQGLIGALGAPAFPVMAELFADKPLTESERVNLAAYFSRESDNEDRDSGDALFVVGLVGAGLLFGGMIVIKPFTGAGYSRRLRRNA
ncbi:MAG: c-type cytochrome [Acidimicrobiia bacterium]